MLQLAPNDTPTAGAPIVLAGPTALLRLGDTSRVSFSGHHFRAHGVRARACSPAPTARVPTI